MMNRPTHDKEVEECRQKNGDSSVTESTCQKEVLVETLLEIYQLNADGHTYKERHGKGEQHEDEEEFEEVSGIRG
jgi:hypothetical protein